MFTSFKRIKSRKAFEWQVGRLSGYFCKWFFTLRWDDANGEEKWRKYVQLKKGPRNYRPGGECLQHETTQTIKISKSTSV